MNSYQRIKFSMYLVVRDYLTGFSSIISSIPNFSSVFTSFLAILIQIQNLAEQLMLDKKGSTDLKKALKKAAVTQGIDVASKVYAFANANNNKLLMSEVKTTKTQLEQLSDVKFRITIQSIYDLAQANIASLAPYGLNATTQTNFLNAINLFTANQNKPRLSIADHKQMNLQLKTLFENAASIFLNIKILVDTQKIAQMSFYNGFYTAIKLNNNLGSSISLKGRAIDATNKEGIEGVSFTFRLDYEASKLVQAEEPFEIEKLTSKKGGFMIKKMPDGIYQLRVFKLGYQEQLLRVVVNSDKLTAVNVELKKEAGNNC